MSRSPPCPGATARPRTRSPLAEASTPAQKGLEQLKYAEKHGQITTQQIDYIQAKTKGAKHEAETEGAKNKAKTEGAKNKAKTEGAKNDILQAKTKSIKHEAGTKHNDSIQAETKGAKYKAGTKPTKYEAGTRQIDIIQDETEGARNYEAGTKQTDYLQAETEWAKHEFGTKPTDILQKTRLAYSVFMNYQKHTDCDQDGSEQVGTKQGAKKYQDGIGTNKPLLGGLGVKIRLAYSVFINYEKK